MTKSEPFLSGTDGALRAPRAQRSGEAGRKRGVGKMNARLALAFAAAKIRANTLARRHIILTNRLSKFHPTPFL
ncbi:MAG: hypothetical protein UW24_C0012G0051 [Parcubacteria group bacterium GW2011_GWA2_44_12]|nr:MAG: hypothetical protein UW24_C0012G0051 [Parcubacteria group bacterium GW2011_GWA2_44_12]